MVHFAKSHLWLLKVLTDHLGDSKLHARLLKSSKPQDLLIIYELCKNILEGNIPISNSQTEKLKKYESKLIYLSEPSKKFKGKVDILLKNKLFLKQLLLIGQEFIINSYYNSESEEEDLETDSEESE
jgi:hypothetical protein